MTPPAQTLPNRRPQRRMLHRNRSSRQMAPHRETPVTTAKTPGATPATPSPAATQTTNAIRTSRAIATTARIIVSVAVRRDTWRASTSPRRRHPPVARARRARAVRHARRTTDESQGSAAARRDPIAARSSTAPHPRGVQRRGSKAARRRRPMSPKSGLVASGGQSVALPALICALEHPEA